MVLSPNSAFMMKTLLVGAFSVIVKNFAILCFQLYQISTLPGLHDGMTEGEERAFWSCFSCFLYFALLFWNQTWKKWKYLCNVDNSQHVSRVLGSFTVCSVVLATFGMVWDYQMSPRIGNGGNIRISLGCKTKTCLFPLSSPLVIWKLRSDKRD